MASSFGRNHSISRSLTPSTLSSIYLHLQLGLTSGLPIKSSTDPDAIPITEMTKPAAVVLDEQGNALDQATGRYLQISQRMPTLKVNIREKKKELLKNNAELVLETEEQEVQHFDPRVG